jgi:hypothetical protein
MDKATKLEKATLLIDTGRALIRTPQRTNDPVFIKWRADALTFLQRMDVRCATDFEKVSYGLWAITSSTPEHRHQQAFDNGVARAVALLESARAEIQDYETEPSKPLTRSTLDEVVALCRRFPKAARRLHTRHAKRKGILQKDEYDVQDVLHAFLLLHFDDVRPEEWTPSYGGSSARVDFLLPDERIVIEVKRTRDKLGGKDAKEQLAVDIDHYRVHPKCSTLVCFVYDPDHRIANAVGFEKDLEGQRTDMLDVRVVVAPHG